MSVNRWKNTLKWPAKMTGLNQKGSGFLAKYPLAVMTCILLIAAFARLWQLGEAPPGLQHDELFKAQEGQSIVTDGNFRLFYETNQGHEGGYVWLLALSYLLFGNSLIMVKFPAFACGMLTVALLYRVAREIYNFRVAVFASGLAAVSFWAIFTSRVGLRAVLLPPIILIAIWGLWRVCYFGFSPHRSGVKQWLLALLTGVFLGFAIYTYTASIALYAAFAAFLGAVALFDRATLKKRWKPLLVVTLAGTILTLPMLYHRLNNPMGQNRLNSISRPYDEFKKGNPDELLQNAQLLVKMPAFSGDPEWRYNIAGRPLFILPIGILVYLGFCLMLWRLRHQPINALFLTLSVVGLVPSLLTVSAPSFLRSIATLPGLMLFIALSIDWIGYIRPAFNRTVWGLGIFAIGLTALVDWSAYFTEWVEHDEVQAIYRDDLEQLAHYLREQDEKLVLVSSSSPEYLDPLIYLFSNPPDETQVVWFKGGVDIALNDEPTLLFVSPLEPIVPSHADWLKEQTGTAHVDTLYRQDGEVAFEVYEISSEGNVLETRLEEVSQWQVYLENNSTLTEWDYPINFGNILQLIGVEMPRTTIPEVDNGVDNGLNLQLYLQPLVDNYNIPLSLFVHFVAADGSVPMGRDFLGVPANWWSDDIIFIQDNYVGSYKIPVGPYWVTMGLYRTDTGERYPIVDEAGNILGERIIVGVIEAVPQ